MLFKQRRHKESDAPYFVTLYMNDGTTREKSFSTTGAFTLPAELPFQQLSGMEFLGWSYEPFGEIISNSSVTVTKNTVFFARYRVTVILDPGEGTGTPQEIIMEQTPSYVLPTTTTFVAPTGKTFDGWTYAKNGPRIPNKVISIVSSITLFVFWGSGFEDWIQILDPNNPIVITKPSDIYKYNDSSKLYRLSGSTDQYLYNGFELTGLKITNTFEVSALPRYAPSDILYHNTTDNTYWHYEYDIIKSLGGMPIRSDGNCWENLNILSVDIPKIGTNTYEIYYKTAEDRNYFYDYLKEEWFVQNPDGPDLKEYEVIAANNLELMTAPVYLPDKIFKIEKIYGGNLYWTWLRLVDSAHHIPPRPKVDPTIYWVITNDYSLYISAHPIVSESGSIRYSGNFPSNKDWGSGTVGPWVDYRTQIKLVTVLEDIAPAAIGHWFDYFTACTGYNGLDKIKVDYCSNFRSTFAVPKTLKFLDLSSWRIGPNADFTDFLTSSSDQGDTPLEEVDLSGWDTSQTKTVTRMFRYNRNLKHIYVGDDWNLSAATAHSGMFESDRSLHNWQSSSTDKTKAIIDDGSNGGYLERKEVVTLKPNGGKGDISKRYVLKNNDFTLDPNFFSPPNDSKKFFGWSTSTSEDDIISGDTITITADITLYAIWK